MPTSESDSSCQHVGRKKRRGMIEKRRRDRINNSLNELRRLVPAAFEKQGSAKLEKAEILQMTVDHLTMLHAKGFDAFSFDPHKFATDYHGIGFRECASECARYLVAVEGMDLQDPFRLRLMSHLQCYATQRELALKTSAHASAWNPSAFTTPHQFATPAIPPQLPSHSTSSTDPSWCHSTTATSAASSVLSDHSHSHPHQLSMSAHVMPPPPLFDQSSVKRSSSPPAHVSSTVPTLQSAAYGHHPASVGQMSTATAQYFTTPGYTVSHTATGSGQSGASVKHYRPWGAELAY